MLYLLAKRFISTMDFGFIPVSIVTLSISITDIITLIPVKVQNLIACLSAFPSKQRYKAGK